MVIPELPSLAVTLLMVKLGNNVKGLDWNTEDEYEQLKVMNGTVKVPVAVRDAVVGLGEVDDDRPHFDSVETTRLPDAFDAVEDLLPRFATCTAGAANRGVSAVVAGARVALA